MSDELDDLRATVRAFLAEACPPTAVRRLMADPAAHDAALWRRLAGELGLTGLAVPEEHGGAGCGLGELAVVCEELGRALTPVPYLATAVLAAHAVRDGHLLAGIADGSLIATVVLDGDLTANGDRLTGTAPYVLDGHLADVIVCAAGGRVYAVRGADVARTPYVTLDQTRRLARLRFDRTPAEPIDGDVTRLRDIALTALAAEQVGGAQWCLETAVEYAKTRVQFGRPIGSFQAIKHKLADVLLRVESARSAAYEAARVADHEPESLPVYAALAASYCAEAHLHAAGETIQVLGGIGVTWEHDAQLHFKRATASARLFGSPESHRARLAAAVGL
ncbi:acyl-CoA/acyl-ACP dehydrogenase [Actinoallomurus purpureus]|uniref:acyl-CoA dehydrogenase family protein n=1 Tax=Actinoallomurus purpureus TaxID=478114 RepID=UPI002093E382|nr:acyl-CoA dehydrogenase family protein [Actinoallomurus purpureus]MCO6006471.1 acyl-CoA/acyl-ACP dehydrogenase [Actinoallomurus purpureus]